MDGPDFLDTDSDAETDPEEAFIEERKRAATGVCYGVPVAGAHAPLRNEAVFLRGRGVSA